MRGLPPLVGVLAVLCAAAAAAQEPDTVAAPPAAAEAPESPADTAGPPAAPGPAVETLGYDPARWTVSLAFGTLGFGDLQTQPVQADRVDGLGTTLSTGAVTRTVRAEGGLQGAVAATASLGRAWAVRAGAGIGRTTVGSRYSGAGLYVDAANRVSAPLDVPAWLFVAELGLRYRVAASGRARPYVELGGGTLHWQPDRSDAVPDLDDGWRPAVFAAVGAVVPLGGVWRAELRAMRRLSRTPAPATAGLAVGPSSPTIRLTTVQADATARADAARELVSELRFDVGISAGFGRVPGPDRPGTTARPSPPGR